MTTIVMIDVECIGSPNGVMLMDGINYGAFELGWAAASFVNGTWVRQSGKVAMPFDEKVIITDRFKYRFQDVIDAVAKGDVSGLPINPQARDCVDWWLSQGCNVELSKRLGLAHVTDLLDTLQQIEQRLLPLLRDATTVWASEMPLDLSFLQSSGYLHFAKKRCLRTVRNMGLLTRTPLETPQKHDAQADANWQLDLLFYNAYQQSDPRNRRLLLEVMGIPNLRFPCRDFYINSLPEN